MKEKEHNILVRKVKDKTKKKIQKRAKKNNRSVNSEIIMILEKVESYNDFADHNAE